MIPADFWHFFQATAAKSLEVRRILAMGLPFTSNHGGQILFGPKDGYLYFMMGDGGGPGNAGDPYNFSQNKKSLLGKIMRLDVDNIPSECLHRIVLITSYLLICVNGCYIAVSLLFPNPLAKQ